MRGATEQDIAWNRQHLAPGPEQDAVGAWHHRRD